MTQAAARPPLLARLFAHRWARVLAVLLAVPTLAALALGVWVWQRFAGDVPVEYADIEEHFKYGSTGGERESGFPYWIFQALPQVCAEHLPGKGYASLGMIFEEGKDLPVGMSKRRYTGIDRTFLNCAVCHASTVRDAPDAKPRLYLGMPAANLDIMAFEKFFFGCAKDPKFSAEYIVPEARRLVQAQGGDLDLLDRYLVYPVAVALMRERLLMLAGRFSFVMDQPAWGPGRVDTFNSAKVIFNFPMHRLPDHEKNAPADFPSIWLQQPREGMQLHWDGNNTAVTERNKSAAFGTGTTPPTIDLANIGRIEHWLLTKEPPKYPYPVDAARAARGAALYQEYCAGCHGAGPRDFRGEHVGRVMPIEAIGTDRRRLDSYTYDLAVNQGTLYAGYDWRFKSFRKTHGYANMPLDGLWLRAPYLHNGSVPSLRDLLEPASARPQRFYRGNDVYDPVRVGFVSDVPAYGARRFFAFDTAIPGNANAGHEGPRYGTALAAADKDALVEFLKTF
jgi:mono/diheme cytochrome c family protein